MLAVFVLSAIIVQLSAGLTNNLLLEFSCSGKITFLPGTPLYQEFDYGSTFGEHGKWYYDRLFARAQCTCPQMTRAQFDSAFAVMDPAWVVAFVLGGNFPDFSGVCPQGASDWSSLLSGFDRTAKNSYFTFPASVNLTSLRQGSTQYMKLNFGASLNMSIGVSFGKCATTANQLPMPWFQAYCLGPDCNLFGFPCNTNLECASQGSALTCMPLLDGTTGLDPFTPVSMYDAFVSAKFYDQNDNFPGCFSVQSILETGLSFVRQKFFQLGGTYSNAGHNATALRLCLPPTLTNLTKFADLFNVTALCPQDPVTSTVACSNLVSYDGSGAPSSASATNNVPSTYPALTPDTPGARILFFMSCSGDMYILPSYPKLRMKSAMQMFAPMMRLAEDIIKPMEQCRASGRGGSLSDSQLYAFYGFIETWLYHFVKPSAAVPLTVPSQSTIMDAIYPPNGTATRQFVQFPATCTYDSWPSCSLRWTGLSSLTGLDITIQGYVKQCPGAKYPSFYAECVGTGCSLLDFIPCTGPTDITSCPINSLCTDVANKTSVTTDPQTYKVESFADSTCGAITQTINNAIPSVCLQGSGGSLIFWPQNGTHFVVQGFTDQFCQSFAFISSGVFSSCLAIPPLSLRITANPIVTHYKPLFAPVFEWMYNSNSSTTCRDETRNKQDVKSFVDYMSGSTPVQSTTAYMCYVAEPTAAEAEAWATAQSSTNGDTITITSLAPWTPTYATTDPVTTGAPAATTTTGAAAATTTTGAPAATTTTGAPAATTATATQSIPPQATKVLIFIVFTSAPTQNQIASLIRILATLASLPESFFTITVLPGRSATVQVTIEGANAGSGAATISQRLTSEPQYLQTSDPSMPQVESVRTQSVPEPTPWYVIALPIIGGVMAIIACIVIVLVIRRSRRRSLSTTRDVELGPNPAYGKY